MGLNSMRQMELPEGSAVRSAAVGNMHAVLLGTKGEVWTVSCLSSVQRTPNTAQMGHGEDEEIVEGQPLLVKALRRSRVEEVPAGEEDTLLKAVEVAAGHYHSIVKVEGGAIFVFGQEDGGRLGLGEGGRLGLGEIKREVWTPQLLQFGGAVSVS